MSNDAKMAKFKLVLEEIEECLCVGCYSAWDDLTWTGLALIYDYYKLNEYGKCIMDSPDLSEYSAISDFDEERESLLDDYDDEAFKVRKAKEFVEEFEGRDGSKEIRYTFMFWALLILSVDDTNRDEHLASICDLAKIWKISDEEMMDVVRVIRIVYYREMAEEKFQSYSVTKHFEILLGHYGYDRGKVLACAEPNVVIMSRMKGGINDLLWNMMNDQKRIMGAMSARLSSGDSGKDK
ncbi:MAG: hypothetical protein NC321_02685 [Clostridium sp.]|nr:hypothetical protein [Clostridium sp.]